MDLLTLPYDILNIILRKIENILFLLLVCKKSYALKANLQVVFGVNNNFWVSHYLGRFKTNQIILGYKDSFFLTTRGFARCCKQHNSNKKDLSKDWQWSISLNLVKRFAVFEEKRFFSYHSSNTVVVLFSDGTLEFIKLRGKYCPNIDLRSILQDEKISKFLMHERQQKEFSYERRFLLTGISDFAADDKNLFVISDQGKFIHYRLITTTSVFESKLQEFSCSELNFTVLSFVIEFEERNGNITIFAIRECDQRVLRVYISSHIEELNFTGLYLKRRKGSIYVLDENKILCIS